MYLSKLSTRSIFIRSGIFGTYLAIHCLPVERDMILGPRREVQPPPKSEASLHLNCDRLLPVLMHHKSNSSFC